MRRERLVLWFLLVAALALALRPWVEDLRLLLTAEPRAVAARGELAADEQTTIEIFRATSPSVVYITTTRPVLDLSTRNLREVPRGTGSGLIWDEVGHVVTNYHVVEGMRSAYVRLADDRS